MKITLDTNCLIDVEQGEEAAEDVKQLLAHHDAGYISIQIPAIAGSERLQDSTYASTFEKFHQRISKLAQREIELLKPLAYLGIVYLDWCILGDENMVAIERKIHEILFPEIQFEWQAYAESHGISLEGDSLDPRWRNAKCDTLGLWSHSHYGGDIFVTRDKNFHKVTKKPVLAKLGAREILYPAEAVTRVA